MEVLHFRIAIARILQCPASGRLSTMVDDLLDEIGSRVLEQTVRSGVPHPCEQRFLVYAVCSSINDVSVKVFSHGSSKLGLSLVVHCFGFKFPFVLPC